MTLNETLKAIAALVAAAPVLGFVWAVYSWADEVEDTVKVNKETLYALQKTVVLTSLNDQIGDVTARANEDREKLSIAEHPELRVVLSSNIAGYTQQIEELKATRQCVIEDRNPCQ